MSLPSSIRALITRAKKAPAAVEMIQRTDLPAHSGVKKSPGQCDLLVQVEYSNLNYKDAMIVTGTYPGLPLPMVGGVDLAGKVAECQSGAFKVGEPVFINAFGMGSDHFGGYAQLASVRSEWAVSSERAGNLSSLEAARIGTAGFTAMLCVQALQTKGVKPEDGPVLVTGATGGVGSVATAILSSLGYDVVALTGKVEEAEAWLKQLGAKEVLARSTLEADGKPLGKEIYAGCVDTVGDKVLVNALSQIKYGGSAAICGLAGGMGMPGMTVAPFILRGVTLFGIDCVFYPGGKHREELYGNYAPTLIKSGKLDLISGSEQVLKLEDVPEVAGKMLKGQIKGRYVVDPNKE